MNQIILYKYEVTWAVIKLKRACFFQIVAKAEKKLLMQENFQDI